MCTEGSSSAPRTAFDPSDWEMSHITDEVSPCSSCIRHAYMQCIDWICLHTHSHTVAGYIAFCLTLRGLNRELPNNLASYIVIGNTIKTYIIIIHYAK